MSLTGPRPDDPTKVGVPIADLLAGMYGAYGVLAALHERQPHRPRPGGPHLAAGRHGRRARLPGHPLDGGRRGARRPPARTTRRSARTGCSSRRRHGADRGRQRRAVAVVRRRVRPRPARVGHQRRPGRRPGRGDRGRRRGLRRLPRERTDGQAGRARHPGRPGAVAGRGLRVGADPVAGTADRRGAPEAGNHHPARPAAALRRRRPGRAHAARRCWASTTTRSWPGWTSSTRSVDRHHAVASDSDSVRIAGATGCRTRTSR